MVKKSDERGDNYSTLREVILENNLTYKGVALNTGYSYNCVKAWLMPDRESSRARDIPSRALRMLTLRIETGNLLRPADC